MYFERTKNSARYFVFGTLNRVVSLLLPFALRTLIIYYLGEEYLGINSLFSSILSVLNLAELGFSTAVGNSMYKPIAEDDTDTVCALMALYKKVYRIIGVVVFAVGLALLPFLDVFIRGECPENINIYVLYIIYLASSAGGYFLFAYRRTILSAYQRGDIIEIVNMVIKFLTIVVQALSIIFLKNIYLYVLMNFVNGICCNLICAYISSRKFPQYHCKGRVDEKIKKSIYKKVTGLMIQKLGQTLSTQLDAIVISSFLGLVIVARYSNYSYIANSVGSFIQLFFGSMTAGIGNAMVLNSVEWNYKNFKRIQFVSSWIVGWCSICLMVLYQPFISIWTGEDTLLPMFTVVFMVIYFYIGYNKRLVPTFKDAAGMWWEDKFKPLVSGLANLSVNIILVQMIGINGVIISTILSYLFIEIPWETHVVFKKYFDRSAKEYYFRHIKYLLLTVVAGAFTYLVCSFIPDGNLFLWLAKAVICLVIPNIIYFLVLRKQDDFQYIAQLVSNLLNNFLPIRRD